MENNTIMNNNTRIKCHILKTVNLLLPHPVYATKITRSLKKLKCNFMFCIQGKAIEGLRFEYARGDLTPKTRIYL